MTSPLPVDSSSGDFSRFIADQIRTWGQVVIVANIKID